MKKKINNNNNKNKMQITTIKNETTQKKATNLLKK